jgi:hypothetical protein
MLMTGLGDPSDGLIRKVRKMLGKRLLKCVYRYLRRAETGLHKIAQT